MIKELMRDAFDVNASDIHLTVGLPPMFRVNGVLRQVGEEPLRREDTYTSNKKNKKEEKDKKNNFYQNSSFTSFSQQAKPVLSAGAAQIRALAQGGCHE